MTDTIIKGTGNSRTLKTVPNAAALYPDFNAFLSAFIDGSLPVDIGPLNPTGLQQRGTDLNKENLLKDATASSMGLNSTATPNDAFAKLLSFISNKSTVVSGSYTGNGAIGQSNGSPPSNPPSLTFQSSPKCVIITTDWVDKDWVFLVLVNGITNSGSLFREQYSSTSIPVACYRAITTWSGNKVSWYTYGWRGDANDAKASANTSGKIYRYIAIL